jgi:hypothetical protein
MLGRERFSFGFGLLSLGTAMSLAMSSAFGVSDNEQRTFPGSPHYRETLLMCLCCPLNDLRPRGRRVPSPLRILDQLSFSSGVLRYLTYLAHAAFDILTDNVIAVYSSTCRSHVNVPLQPCHRCHIQEWKGDASTQTRTPVVHAKATSCPCLVSSVDLTLCDASRIFTSGCELQTDPCTDLMDSRVSLRSVDWQDSGAAASPRELGLSHESGYEVAVDVAGLRFSFWYPEVACEDGGPPQDGGCE